MYFTDINVINTKCINKLFIFYIINFYILYNIKEFIYLYTPLIFIIKQVVVELKARTTIRQTQLHYSFRIFLYIYIYCIHIYNVFFFPPSLFLPNVEASREACLAHWHFHRLRDSHEYSSRVQACIQGECIFPMQYANIIPTCSVSGPLPRDTALLRIPFRLFSVQCVPIFHLISTIFRQYFPFSPRTFNYSFSSIHSPALLFSHSTIAIDHLFYLLSEMILSHFLVTLQ